MQGVLRLDQIERRAPKLLAAERPYAVAAAIEAALPLPLENVESFGIAAWAIDYYLSRSSDGAERDFAAHLRTQVLSPLREHISPPRLDLLHWEWRSIPGGSFEMGSREGDSDEQPVHLVTISPFYLGACTVTNRDFRRLVKVHEGEDDLPVVNVSWRTAYAYAAWIGGRLPTEAEWEYACRAGTKTSYCSGNGLQDLRRVGWYDSHWLHPVGELEANSWGLHDMHGNVWEWVADMWGPYSNEPQVDPWGPAVEGCRIIRGGSYVHSARFVTAAYRHYQFGADAYTGFRVALPISSKILGP